MNGLTVVLAFWGAIGPLAGIIIGHLLSRSWQRKQWIMDRRNEEFRGLIEVLVESFTKYGDIKYVLKPETRELMLEQSAISMRCYAALNDRIYIAEDVKRLNLVRQWADAIDKFQTTKNPEEWGRALKSMTAQIVEAALKSN